MLAIAAVVHAKNAELLRLRAAGREKETEDKGLEETDGSQGEREEEGGEAAEEKAGATAEAAAGSGGVASPSGGCRFVYYVKKLPRWLRANPSGNFARAVALGAEVI